MQTIVIAVLKGYKAFVSPLLPSACRFYPTCSEYMLEAVRLHGVVRGVWMGLKRLGRCHPFHQGGYDPVSTAAMQAQRAQSRAAEQVRNPSIEAASACPFCACSIKD
jgi:putative membrane protein insertion efficiency factor